MHVREKEGAGIVEKEILRKKRNQNWEKKRIILRNERQHVKERLI